ncbi:MAG: helix-turn-helix transcriptional regulator [Bacteroides sp.]|nr:helix-turn-helix transcriptional regulator [Bacteroides sp.]
MLTKREREIAELFAWGATKKDVAKRLFLSERTVENHARNIYAKTGCTKVNELAAWWFCTTYHISFSLSPLKRGVLSALMGFILLPQLLCAGGDVLFARVRTQARNVRTAGRRRVEEDDCVPLFEIA